MAKEKQHKIIRRKPYIIVLCILLILCIAAGGTLAYMFSKTGQLDNQFALAKVTCQVNANADSSFDVTNTGDVDAYIRAAIVVNWMDDLGNVRGIPPAASEYELILNNTDWFGHHDGYYYYRYSVHPAAEPGSITEDLVQSYGLATGITVPDGYKLAVEVVAEAIQADGTTDVGDIPAVTDAWGVTVGADGNLTN